MTEATGNMESEKKEDFLEVDKPIPGQNFACSGRYCKIWHLRRQQFACLKVVFFGFHSLGGWARMPKKLLPKKNILKSNSFISSVGFYE